MNDKSGFRVGCNAILDELMNNDSRKIYVVNYSLDLQSNTKHSYNVGITLDKLSVCHDVNFEIQLLRWLHMTNRIDATLSMLQDNVLPTLDCTGGIIPTMNLVIYFLKKYGICILQNWYNDMELSQINGEFERVMRERKGNIQILDTEGCSNDERIFYVERYSNIIRDIFSNNKYFEDIARSYNSNLNKKTLINRLQYEAGRIKNSGAGWHRDNHTCQFKTIMYLTDVGIQNGNFQFLTNSSYRHIGKPQPRTVSYDTRFSDDVIDGILKSDKNTVNKVDILGKAGTIILADTTYIHRGNIIQRGIRKAITQYYF